MLFTYVRIFCIVCIPATRRPGGFTRPFPDRSGEYVIVDMLFCNVSSKDFKVNIALQRNEVSVYDELGNQYTKGIYGKFTKDGSLSELPRTLLPSEVPVRFSLYIKDVEEGVTFLPKIIFECRTGYSPAKLSIKNVRISEQ